LLETANGLYQSSERLAQQLNFAAQAIMHTITSGGKVLCAGEAEASWLA
jgi:D-sedoheptulose 7-phosphate isomerase